MVALNRVESEAINGETTALEEGDWREELARSNAFTVITILSSRDFPEPMINRLMKKSLEYLYNDFYSFLEVDKDTHLPECRYSPGDDLMERSKSFLFVPAEFAELSSWDNDETKRQLECLVLAASRLVSPTREDWTQSRVVAFNKKAEKIDWIRLFDKHEAREIFKNEVKAS